MTDSPQYPGVRATELQLLACLGVEPQELEPGIPWYYNTATYTLALGRWHIEFLLQPSSGEVQLRIDCAGQRCFEFSATAVRDVRVIDQPGVDVVEIVMEERSRLTLQLRPSVKITQHFQTEPPILPVEFPV